MKEMSPLCLSSTLSTLELLAFPLWTPIFINSIDVYHMLSHQMRSHIAWSLVSHKVLWKYKLVIIMTETQSTKDDVIINLWMALSLRYPEALCDIIGPRGQRVADLLIEDTERGELRTGDTSGHRWCLPRRQHQWKPLLAQRQQEYIWRLFSAASLDHHKTLLMDGEWGLWSL